MTREEYLEMRRHEELGEICYAYYKIKAEEKNFKVYGIDKFIQALNIWMQMNNNVVETATSYFDNLFTIQTTTLNNKVIRYD